MHFTAREAKMVARLRKTERLWPRLRWAMLGAGIFAWAVYGYIAFSICDRLQAADAGHDSFGSYVWLTGFAMMWPKCLLGFVVGTCLIALAIRDWHGNVNRTLLLKLLEDQEKQMEIALAPPLLAGLFIHRMRAPFALRGVCLVLGGYIQAVHIYNSFNPWQHMGFFRGGWIS